MARRTQIFSQLPWDGGLNSSVDPAMIGPNDLVQAENVVFATSGSRLKREGRSYLDTSLPATATRSSSGTTRTIVFASSVSIASPEDRMLVVGEKIDVSGMGNANYNCSGGTILSVSTTTIEYTFTGAASLAEGSTADTGGTVTKSSTVIGVHDYWYFDSSTQSKLHYYMALTSQGKLFRHDENGRRKEITKRAEVAQVQTVVCGAASTITTGDYFKLYSAKDVTTYLVWYNKDSGGGAPVVANTTLVPVAIAAADTASQVATATQTAIDALADFTASVNTATVTITNAAVGDCTTVVDGPTASATGFTFARTTAGTGPATAIDADPELDLCDMKTYNERLIFTMNGDNNTPKVFYAADATDTWEDLYGAPDALWISEHQGRLLLNDKDLPDRIHYSPVQDHTLWQGRGDSGAVDFFKGDGDPNGISAIFPSFKGQVIVAKHSRIDRVAGDDVTTDPLLPLSTGIGVVSHNAVVAVDMDDVPFPSARGFHSLVATDTTGDFESNFLSKKIQPSFSSWETERFKYMQGAYIQPLNSVAWSVAEEGNTTQNALWLFNVERQEWYVWPSADAQSVTTARDSNGKIRLLTGDSNGRLHLWQNGTYSDFGSTGISYRIKSGTIYVDGSPETIKMFKKLKLYFRPRGDFNFTVYFKVDNFAVQALTFDQTADADELGGEFILGSSILGNASTLAPFTKDITGIGRGCSIEVFQSGAEGQVEIYGYAIEYELADVSDISE
jgi:hypothetical protein